ncbi:MAG: MBL fold metallo-hydrolase [Clostridia bacterium]|nr:MBL fold metallo-hydrolase [Clostridia bacterium]
MKTTCRILSLSLVLIAAVTMLVGLAKPAQAADTAGKAQTLGIISGGKSSYVIVTPKAASEEVESAAQELRDAIRKKTWVSLKVKTDLLNVASKKSDTEILIGHTNRAESAEVMKDVPYGEYAIRVVNQKIVIAAWDDASLLKGCEAFAEYAEKKGRFRKLTVDPDYTASGVAFEGVGAVPPYEDKGITTRYMDLADECYMVHIANTSRGDFLKYVKSLPDAGFTEYSYRQAGKMLYAIYGNEDTILHLSFNGLTREARIAVEDAYDRTIFTEVEYEKVCEPSVSMIGQEFTDSNDPAAAPVPNGLCLVFRLEDGRFIIVDSGATVKSVNLLYETLQKLHVNEGKITVAAWILTHPHGDHTGGFQYLSTTALKNQIVVENIIHHFSSDAQHAAIKTAGTSANTRLAMKRFRGANIIKAHSGQVIQAGGAEVEMLFTYADMEPMVLDQMNTTSLILRVTVQGNSVMVLADTTSRAINHIYKVYGNYLKSDMVQLAHHGVNGGVLLYQTIDADVVLWPIAVDASYNQGVELIRDVAYNKVATDLAEEVYVAGNAVFTLILPYTPADNESAVFYMGKE